MFQCSYARIQDQCKRIWVPRHINQVAGPLSSPLYKDTRGVSAHGDLTILFQPSAFQSVQAL